MQDQVEIFKFPIKLLSFRGYFARIFQDLSRFTVPLSLLQKAQSRFTPCDRNTNTFQHSTFRLLTFQLLQRGQRGCYTTFVT